MLTAAPKNGLIAGLSKTGPFGAPKTAAPAYKPGDVWDPFGDPAAPGQTPSIQRAFQTKSGQWVDTKTKTYIPDPNAAATGPFGANQDPAVPKGQPRGDVPFVQRPWVPPTSTPSRVTIPSNVSGTYQMFDPATVAAAQAGKTPNDGFADWNSILGLLPKDPPPGNGNGGSTHTPPTNAAVNTSGAGLTTKQVQQWFDAMNQQPDMGALSKAATKSVLAALGPTIQGYKANKAEYFQQAQDRAAAVMAAYRAMANMAEPDAKNENAFYRGAGQDMNSLARGFTGPIASQYQQEAAALNAGLRGQPVPAMSMPPPTGTPNYFNSGVGTLTDANSSPTGSGYAPSNPVPTPPALAPGATNYLGTNLATAPSAAANALFAMHGQIPAQLLSDEAARIGTSLQHEPLGIMQQGIDAMQVAQHASDSKEQTINNLIAQARSRIPNLTQTALTNLVNNWRSMHSDQLKTLALALEFGKNQRAAALGDIKEGDNRQRLSYDDFIKFNNLTVAKQRADAYTYEQQHRNDPKPAKPPSSKDIWGIVERAALGTYSKGSAANGDKPVQQSPPMNDPGNAINFVMTHTGMNRNDAIQALMSYNGLRGQYKFPLYDFSAYLAAGARHAASAASQAGIYKQFFPNGG